MPQEGRSKSHIVTDNCKASHHAAMRYRNYQNALVYNVHVHEKPNIVEAHQCKLQTAVSALLGLLSGVVWHIPDHVQPLQAGFLHVPYT